MLSESRPAKAGKWTEPALRVLRERYLTRQDGKVVETATAEVLFREPRHPYTQALMQCRMRADSRKGRLQVIEGVVPLPTERPAGCAFRPRCALAQERCALPPPVVRSGPGSYVLCHMPEGLPRA